MTPIKRPRTYTPGRPWPRFMIDELVRLAEAGESSLAISVKLGATRQAVWQQAQNWGLKIARKQRKDPPPWRGPAEPNPEPFVPPAIGRPLKTVLAATCHHFRIEPVEMISEGPRRRLTRPRMIGMFVARRNTRASFPQIAQRFGLLDHTTALNAYRRIHALREADPAIAGHVAAIEALLTAGRAP